MVALSSTERKQQIWSVMRVSSGNFLEMYDFFVFGYYATAIGKTFFPSGSEFAQLMLAFMTFGAGFLMRPLGGIVLGAYIDHYGRRAGLDAHAGTDGGRNVVRSPWCRAMRRIGALGADHRRDRPADPGLLRRRRARRRLGLSLARSRRRATRAFTSAGNPAASKSP